MLYRVKTFYISPTISATAAGPTTPMDPATGLRSRQTTRNFQRLGISLSYPISRRALHTYVKRGLAPPRSSRKGGSAVLTTAKAQCPGNQGVGTLSKAECRGLGRAERAPTGARSPIRHYAGHRRVPAAALALSASPGTHGCTHFSRQATLKGLLANNSKSDSPHQPLPPTPPQRPARSDSRRTPPSWTFPQVPAYPRPAPWSPGGACAEGQIRSALLRVETAWKIDRWVKAKSDALPAPNMTKLHRR